MHGSCTLARHACMLAGMPFSHVCELDACGHARGWAQLDWAQACASLRVHSRVCVCMRACAHVLAICRRCGCGFEGVQLRDAVRLRVGVLVRVRMRTKV